MDGDVAMGQMPRSTERISSCIIFPVAKAPLAGEQRLQQQTP